MQRILILTSLLVATTLPVAQPPITHVVAVSDEVAIALPPFSNFFVGAPDVVTASPGSFLVAWVTNFSTYRGSQEVAFGGGLSGRRVGLHALPSTAELPFLPVRESVNVESLSLAANASGRFVASWRLVDSNFTANRFQVLDQFGRFDADAQPEGEVVDLYASPVGSEIGGADRDQPVAMDPTGRAAVAWLQPPPASTDGFSDLRAQIFDPAGKAVTGRFPVTGRTQGEASPALAMDGQGNSIVVYRSNRTAPGIASGLYFRRYDSKGRQLGDEVQVAPPADQAYPRVAASADGSFVVVWSESVNGVRARLFDAAGRPSGEAFRVAAIPQAIEVIPAVAMSSRGSFVVVWSGLDADFIHDRQLGRAFSSTGVPQGDEFEIPILPARSAQRVALADNGTFLVTWTSGLNNRTDQISGRAFRALSNRDRCVYRDSGFHCGTATGELTSLLQLGDGAAAGDVPFLADVDGDGADDPCVRQGNAFSCALTGSDGAVQAFPFGAASHLPLMGDVDGDGRADPCVRRGRFFLCDTAHDGGLAEVKIPLGSAEDLPLLADVDGDGRADPCVVSSGSFRCDVSHDGTQELVQAEDFAAGDIPLLGDADGDGRADFCAVRATSLLCDLDRSGSLKPQPLEIEPGDLVVLGKVDRL